MPRDFRLKFIMSIGITVALLVVIISAMFYLQNDIAAKSDQIFSVTQAISDKTAALRNLEELQQQQPTAMPLLAKMDAAIPSLDTLFQIQQNLQNMAQSQNLAFSSTFGAETPAAPDKPDSVSIEMTLQGNYGSILSFINSMETAPGLVSVATVDLVAQPSGGNFNATISGTIPYHE